VPQLLHVRIVLCYLLRHVCWMCVSPTQVISRWTTCTMSPWQVGQFMVACWPYYPWAAALVELSPFLTPCDTRPVSINADVCDAAAQAAVLAAELGYMDAHVHMEQRCSMLEAQLEWVLQHAQGQP